MKRDETQEAEFEQQRNSKTFRASVDCYRSARRCELRSYLIILSEAGGAAEGL